MLVQLRTQILVVYSFGDWWQSKTIQEAGSSFWVCIDRFRHCQPILFLDGIFIRGRQAQGHLLGVTGKSSNRDIISLSIFSCSKCYGTINLFTHVLNSKIRLLFHTVDMVYLFTFFWGFDKVKIDNHNPCSHML